jgi:hypothetical protein
MTRFAALAISLAALCLSLGRPHVILAEDAPTAPQGLMADGGKFSGKLVASSAEPSWRLRFQGESEHEVAAADLVTWGGFVDNQRGMQVFLAGGGILAVDTLRIDEETLRISSDLIGDVAIPLKSVAGIIYRTPADVSRADRLAARVAAPTGQADRVLLDNADELTGTIATLDDAKVKLKAEAGELELTKDRLAAVIFNPILIEKPRTAGLRMIVGLRDGSRASATSMTGDATSMMLKLADGVELKVPTEAISALLPLGGRVEYLSDMKPASYRHIPFLQLSWPFATDASVTGGRLRAGGKLYLKGLGMHSPARITYELIEPFRRFEAEVAIDASAGAGGSVVFRVFADDGSDGWTERASSKLVRGGEPPAPISVDLAGAKRISLLVDFADWGDELDHANWLNARLVR